MRCRDEFGPEYAVPADVLNALLARGWEDTSWHNDTCPTFRHNDMELVLFADAERPEDREMGPTSARFFINSDPATNDDGFDLAPMFTSNDVSELLAYVATLED